MTAQQEQLPGMPGTPGTPPPSPGFQGVPAKKKPKDKKDRWRPPPVRRHEWASLTTCPRCHAIVLYAEPGRYVQYFDPGNLTVAGEIAARLQDRPVYEIFGIARLYLRLRELPEILAGRDLPVVTEHRCGPQWRLEYCPAPGEQRKPYVIPDEPPF